MTIQKVTKKDIMNHYKRICVKINEIGKLFDELGFMIENDYHSSDWKEKEKSQ